MGGWTNRAFAGFAARFPKQDALRKRPFITVPCWTSEVDGWTADDACHATLAQVYRVAHVMRHGTPTTLRQLMAQEGEALRQAGLNATTLPEDELAYAREVIASHLEAIDQPTIFACLFGDEVASEAGYPQLGLPRDAAIQVAIDGQDVGQNEQNEQNERRRRRDHSDHSVHSVD
jgi:hypothetical protein